MSVTEDAGVNANTVISGSFGTLTVTGFNARARSDVTGMRKTTAVVIRGSALTSG